MRAVRLDGGRVRIEEIDPPVRPREEALLGLRLAGICSTDLELLGGYAGFRGVPGHEFVADVLECDDPSWIGARVVGDINCSCQSCDLCMSGHPHHCENRTVLGIVGRDGSFSERFVLPVRNLRRVPDAVPDERAVFAEPLAAALRILEQVDLDPWVRVAVLGDGKLGLLVASVLAERVHDVSLFGRHPGRVPLPVSVRELPVPDEPPRPSERFALVVEATGTPEGLAVATGLVRPLGTLVLKSTHAAAVEVDSAPWVVDEIRIVGSRCGSLDQALEWLEAGRVPTQEMIQGRYPLSRAAEAFELAAGSGCLKVLLYPDS